MDSFSPVKSALRRRRTGYFFRPTHSETTPEMSCESTVAQAAPATPMRSGTMNTMSSTMFKREESTSAYSGVLLSPSARSRFDTRL